MKELNRFPANFINRLLNIPTEAGLWITALLYLGLSNPDAGHYSFCIFRLFGFEHCPGCGLGHSISYLLHGDIVSSFQAHPLGTFALTVLLWRVFTLFKNSRRKSVSFNKSTSYTGAHHGKSN
ncbi:hypothetical protein CEE37_09290 [candidate division LCP-89 bacterium B3_LCP]|uniref:DUF2752 domain-containing protein n=1 Tax=candidate division LCP-89 bacterium B3_LCP TaxID=2012998 RepID=A0A532UY98_UNCL8|nr:MAG: hypothetical protein CEE37_09290 [candidate division LCP-89 bacterium B3_LCP]